MEDDCVDSDDIWFVVSRSFMDGKFSVNVIPFREEHEAWEIVEEEIDETYSQSWLLTPKEYKELRELMNSRTL
jgi:hypothetical protein